MHLPRRPRKTGCSMFLGYQKDLTPLERVSPHWLLKETRSVRAEPHPPSKGLILLDPHTQSTGSAVLSLVQDEQVAGFPCFRAWAGRGGRST